MIPAAARHRLSSFALLLALLPSLHSQSATLNSSALPSPAGADTQCSNLAAGPDGTLYLTWSGPSATPGERALFLATLPPSAAAWTAPRAIASSPLLMENWADFASLCVGTDAALTVQWFQKKPPDSGGHGYDGWYSRSGDAGRTWRAPARLGHEFVALAPLSQGRTLAVWLESARDPAAAPRPKRDPATPRPARDPNAPYAPSMKLLARLLAPDGAALGEWTVDPDVCTCCQNTVAILPGDRVFVSYRGHTRDEIRDNVHALFDLATRAWTAPVTLKDDGWKIAACPVNGPAADARGEALAVAWFTAAGGVARVQARTSTDAGRTFSAPVALDLGRPLGRLETVVLADGSSLVLWLEAGSAENAAGIYARRLWSDGSVSAPQLVTDTTQARASGFPRAALRPSGRVVISWTHAAGKNSIRTLEFDPATLPRSAAKLSLAPPPGGRRAFAAAPEFCIAPLPPASHPASQ